MIGYGCTPAPYYDHDSRCPGTQGFHHGIDVAMPCGTPLFSAVRGVVLDPAIERQPRERRTASGRSGSAPTQYDVLIGHARRVFVRAG